MKLKHIVYKITNGSKMCILICNGRIISVICLIADNWPSTGTRKWLINARNIREDALGYHFLEIFLREDS